jgi:hypothetical protein
MLSQESRRNILNARLSCRKLYDTLPSSFATLLGDRIFRYTMVGTQDLEAIGKDERLKACVTTLTIGCAGFFDDDVSLQDWHFHDRCGTSDRGQLTEAYQACASWGLSDV